MKKGDELSIESAIPLWKLHELPGDFLKSEVERLAREYGYAAALENYGSIGVPMVVLRFTVWGEVTS